MTPRNQNRTASRQPAGTENPQRGGQAPATAAPAGAGPGMSIAPATQLPQAPTDEEIEQIKSRGKQLIAAKKEANEVFRVLEGLEWGAGTQLVKGSALSEMTRYALAQFCVVTRANPLVHLDILGGRPYLNAQYWADRINSEPLFIQYYQRDISKRAEAALRERGAAHRRVAESLPQNSAEAAERIRLALEFEDDADNVALARAQWGVPEWATCAYETTIEKFIPATPIEKIRSGELLDWERYVIKVTECNWAGNKPEKKKRDGGSYDADPVGNAEPEKTARTRSLRRCAVRSFPAWMAGYEEQIRKAEEVLEAEWTEIKTGQRIERAALPAPGGPQSVRTGAGEPSAQRPTAAAEPLPTRSVDSARNEEPPFEETPELANLRERYREGCSVLGLDPEAYARRELRGRDPQTADEYRMLLAQLDAIADGEAEGDEREPGLGI